MAGWLINYPVREGKVSLSHEVAGILERIGTTAEAWQARLEKLRQGRLLGRFFAASRQRLREVADRLRLKRVPNLGGCRATWCVVRGAWCVVSGER
jgi:hypothetical protein